MDNLTTSIMNFLRQKDTTDDSYSTGVGLPTGYGVVAGSQGKKISDIRALRELYHRAIMNGDDATAEQIMGLLNQIQGGQIEAQGNNQGY